MRPTLAHLAALLKGPCHERIRLQPCIVPLRRAPLVAPDCVEIGH